MRNNKKKTDYVSYYSKREGKVVYSMKKGNFIEEIKSYSLEYFGLSYDPIKILEREQYWKKCLDTIRNGYNDN